MKLNHMICPQCEHDCYTDAAYVTCDGCGCMYYASQSKTQKKNNLMGMYWPLSRPVYVPPTWAVSKHQITVTPHTGNPPIVGSKTGEF